LALGTGAIAIFKPGLGGVAGPHSLHLEITTYDDNYALRWSLLKRHFTQTVGQSKLVLAGKRKGEKGMWQRRFWEHAIRDERDLENHYVYIRGNPVRHGLVKRFEDWPHSSFYQGVVPHD
jgi:putative transposase